MPQHGRRHVAAVDEPVQRVGGISVETALVLALVALISAGSFLVHTLMPTDRATETVVGDKKVRITTVGRGGVLPGPIQPRAIPVVVPPAAAPIVAKPVKTKKPKPTATAIPVATTDPGGGGPLPGDPGGGENCTILILCRPGQTPAPPDDSGQVEATEDPAPGATAPPAAVVKKKQPTDPPVAP